MSVFKKHDRYWDKIAVYGDYRPWGVHKENGGTRADYPSHSGKILDLKGGRADAATHFAGMIGPELEDGVVIVTVPGHDPAKPGGGLRRLAAELVTPANRRVNGSQCLVRSKKIAKLAHGGDRSKEVHLNSITVEQTELIKGKNVLLLDDVTKTGHSLEACRELLLKAGAASVECATIGKT